MENLFKTKNEEEITSLELEDILNLVKTCGFEKELINLLVYDFSESNLRNYLRAIQISELIEIKHQVFKYKTIRWISFNKPSEYITLLKSQNQKLNTLFWVDRFECLEDLITKLVDRFDNYKHTIHINLDEVFKNDYKKLIFRCYFDSDFTPEMEQDGLFYLFMTGNKSLSIIQEYIQVKFKRKGMDKAGNLTRFNSIDFDRLFSPDYHPQALIDFVLE